MIILFESCIKLSLGFTHTLQEFLVNFSSCSKYEFIFLFAKLIYHRDQSMTSGSSVGKFLDFMTCIFQLMLIIYLNWKLHNRFCCNEQKLVCIIMYKSTKYFALVKVSCKASHLLEHLQLNLVKVKKNQQKCTFFYLHISKRRKKNLYNDIDMKSHFTSKTFFMYVHCTNMIFLLLPFLSNFFKFFIFI